MRVSSMAPSIARLSGVHNPAGSPVPPALRRGISPCAESRYDPGTPAGTNPRATLEGGNMRFVSRATTRMAGTIAILLAAAALDPTGAHAQQPLTKVTVALSGDGLQFSLHHLALGG